MEQEEKNRETTADAMLPLWKRMHDKGVAFFVDGEAVDPVVAAFAAVREDDAYMADYVVGQEGRLEQVRLDRVKGR